MLWRISGIFWVISQILAYTLDRRDLSSLQQNYSSYVPVPVTCPNSSLIRAAISLSDEEEWYIANRNNNSQEALKVLLAENLGDDVDVSVLQPINIALAISGGGYRAMLTAAGALKAYDSRSFSNSTLKGLLQASNYIGGISGGSWLVLGNAMNDFEPIEKLIEFKLDLGNRLLEGVPDFDPGYKGSSFTEPQDLKGEKEEEKGWVNSMMKLFSFPPKEKIKNPFVALFQSFKTQNGAKETTFRMQTVFDFYKKVHFEVSAKKNTGSLVSFTDYWSRALRRRVFPKSVQKFSSVMELESMKRFQQPFPIVTAVQKMPGSLQKGTSSTVEINPFEFGSWDKNIRSFFKLKYLGSKMNGGKPSGSCVVGYDDVAFVAATSSSLFNSVFVRVWDYLTDATHETKSAIETIFKAFGLTSTYIGNHNSSSVAQHHSEFAIYSPNPFFNYSYSSASIRNSQHLYLADGGDEGQNIPFHSFLQPERREDLVVAFDMSSDIYNLPNGTCLKRTFRAYQNHTQTFKIANKHLSVFPKVPEVTEFALLNTQPIFLGCDPVFDYPIRESSEPQNPTNSHTLPPLIVYIANRPVSFPSNTSTFQLSYTQKEIKGMLQNGFDLATNKNSQDFAACLNCAAIKRNFDAMKYMAKKPQNVPELPQKCIDCFNKFCYHNFRRS